MNVFAHKFFVRPNPKKLLDVQKNQDDAIFLGIILKTAEFEVLVASTVGQALKRILIR